MTTNGLAGLRALGYTRRSTEEQSDTSNAQQEGILRNYATKNEMIWVGVEDAKGVSGANTEHRGDLDALIRRAEDAHDFDVLLIQSYDRLTRGGARHGGYLLHRFEQLGVRVISVSHDIPDGEWASVIEAVEFSKGRAYSKSLAYATTRGALASIFDGRAAYCRKVPFAVDRLITDGAGNKLFRVRNLPGGEQVKLRWDRDEEIERYPRNTKGEPFAHFVKRKEEKIVLVNGEAVAVQLVRDMFRMKYVEGSGIRRVTMWLNDQGMLTPRGNLLWNEATVHSILNNSVYANRGVCNRLAEGQFNHRTHQPGQPPVPARKGLRAERLRAPEEWVVVSLSEIDILPTEMREIVWERQRAAMVRRAEYGEAVRRVEQAKREGRVEQDVTAKRRLEQTHCRPDTKWPLVDSIFERSTGSPMVGHLCGPTMSHRYYTVRKLRTNPTSAAKGRRKFFPADAVERAVLDVIADVTGDSAECRRMIEEHVKQAVHTASADRPELEALREERQRVRRKKAVLIDQFDDIGEDLLRSKLGPLTSQIKVLDGRIASAERQGGMTSEQAGEIVDALVAALAAVPATLGEPSSPMFRSLIGILTRTSVDLDAREAEIEVRIPGDALARPVTIQSMCASSGSARRTSSGTHEVGDLSLGKFGCQRHTANRRPCLSCRRLAA